MLNTSYSLNILHSELTVFDGLEKLKLTVRQLEELQFTQRQLDEQAPVAWRINHHLSRNFS